MRFKIGDVVVPKDQPELADEIVDIRDYLDDIVYVLENGCLYTDDELQ